MGSYQLSVFGFQIMAVFGRIRIVHLAHYSVRFEFELIFGTALVVTQIVIVRYFQ